MNHSEKSKKSNDLRMSGMAQVLLLCSETLRLLQICVRSASQTCTSQQTANPNDDNMQFLPHEMLTLF
jgi:hypothetical protein